MLSIRSMHTFCCGHSLTHTPSLHSRAPIVQVVEAGNYDGPDMTYYLDRPDEPPVGPDDATEGDKNGARPSDMDLHLAFWATQKGMF